MQLQLGGDGDTLLSDLIVWFS